MKRTSLLKTLLLLCALIAGSESVWAQKQYKKVTSASELVNGAKYLIVSVESSSKYYSIGAVQSNNRTAVEVSVSGDIATATVATTSGSSLAHEVQLVASSTNWNLYDIANGMYLNGGAKKSSGNNNYLKTQASVVTGTGTTTYNGVWSISVADGTGVATIKNQNNFSIQYNSSSTLIASYSSSQTDVCLYKEIAEPAAPITSNIWDFSSTLTQAAALNGGSFNASAENTLYDTNLLSTIIYSAGSGDEMNASGYLKHNGATSDGNKRYFILEIANSGTLEIFSKQQFGTYSIKKAATASTSWSSATDITTISPTSETPSASTAITYDADKPYLFIGLSVKAYTQKMVWTPTTNTLTLTTTDNMAGWRAFYDATQDYEVDANTKIYVAAKSGTAGNVTLTETAATKIPHGEAVILKTSAVDHKMVLTKTTGAASLGSNVLEYAASAAVDGYRLGYKSGTGVAFYKYTATAPASGVVYIDKANVNTGAGAPEFLAFDFGGETTAIQTVNAEKANVAPRKMLKDGRIVIETAEGTFLMNGSRVK